MKTKLEVGLQKIGPPDKYLTVPTAGMTSPAALSSALAAAFTSGYTTFVCEVQDPTATNGTWIVMGGYTA